MNVRWVRHITVLLSLCAAPLCSYAGSYEPSPTVSIVSLIANPTKYTGKPIQTLGFLSIAEEEENIFLSEEDYLHGLYSNSIQLRLTHAQRESAKALNLKYVIVEGTLSVKGERPDWPIPKLVSVRRLEEWNIHRRPAPDASQGR
jgi:hypothetical protein